MLKALSELVLWIEGCVEDGASADFRREALSRLGGQISFDRAIWAEATIVDGMKLRSAELFNIPPARKEDFERAASVDPRLARVLGGPRIAHAYSVLPEDPEEYRALVGQIDVGHLMSIGEFDPIMTIVTGMVLFARPEHGPFDDAERRFAEAAYPHLVAGWRRCQIAELRRLSRSQSAQPGFSAVAQGSMVNAADPGFLLLMRREWPDWTGPHLPPDLTDPETGTVRSEYSGRFIVVNSRRAVDAALVTARERSAIDAMTVRERAVAELCARGFAYRDIAAELGISPATARNHIAAVHRRLGIKRNGEIARLLSVADR